MSTGNRPMTAHNRPPGMPAPRGLCSSLGTIVTSRGTVEKISGTAHTVLVRPFSASESACGSCTACGQPAKEMRMTVRRDGPERFAEGDTVYLSRFVFNPLAAALLMFAVPLAFLVATLIIVVAGLSLDAGSPHTALAALASLPFGFVPAFVVDRRAVRDNPPVLCRTPPSCGNQD